MKENKVSLKLDVKTALDILQVLDGSVAQYSEQHAPERIIRLRAALEQLDQELEKAVS